MSGETECGFYAAVGILGHPVTLSARKWSKLTQKFNQWEIVGKYE